jgi:asparagine synthase (glutamine-hydrolysing)
MCSISGFNWDDKNLAREMNHCLKHRGPDGSGIFNDSNVTLGHTRLSIIDLSAAGKQPMCNEDENVWITFNGEIYNYKKLRSKLISLGHRFKSNTDTEVIVHGYEEWGIGVVNKLNGMFAFAIYDSVKKKLFVARDRFGIKGVYYYWNPEENKFVFASEIKAILCSGLVERKVDLKAAYNYLNLRYVPFDNTFFEDVKKVLPGEILVYDYTKSLDDNEKLKIVKFWDLAKPNKTNCFDVATNVHDLLNESVKKRLMADVPVGVYLSGGVDSASIVALASKVKEESVNTFTIGFDSSFDETKKARAISEHFCTNHQEKIIEGSVGKLLPKLIYHLDMPHGDPVTIPMFHLSKMASSKVKVVLSGEGADEVFGGYVQYKKMLQLRKMKLMPKFMGRVAQRVPVKVLDKFFDYPASIGNKGREKISDLFEDLKDEPKSFFNLTSIQSKKDRVKMKIKEDLNLNKDWQVRREDYLSRMLYYDTKRWLSNYVLFVNDRMTMANSIEGRVPFLDHKLVEFCNNVSSSAKISGGTNKVVLRQAMSKVLPKQVGSTKKHAFLMPLDKWYKDELKDMAMNLFSRENVARRGYFDHDHISKIWQNYNKSKLIYGKQLFTMINFELWHRMFIDNQDDSCTMNLDIDRLVR